MSDDVNRLPLRIVTIRIERANYQRINAAGERVWRWTLTSDENIGRGATLVTDRDGCGIYLLSDGDAPGFPEGWDRRLTQIVSADDFKLSSGASTAEAMKAMASVLDDIAALRR